MLSGQGVPPQIPLPAGSETVTKVAVPRWPNRFYYLDTARMEVLVADGKGQVLNRYGGWGSGPHALDLPIGLVAAENSVWVLDQAAGKIVRLDSRLNPVAELLLPDTGLPSDFVRDAWQRLWIASEQRPGLAIIDDMGRLVDRIGDGSGSAGLVQHPGLLAADGDAVLVWDPVARELVTIALSGTIARRTALAIPGRVLALAAHAGGVALLTDQAVWRWADGELVRAAENLHGWVDLVAHEGTLLALQPGKGLAPIAAPR